MFTAREVTLALAIAMLLMLVSIADAGCHRHKHKCCNPCKKCCPEDEEETTIPGTIPTTSPTCDSVTCEAQNYDNCYCWKKECFGANQQSKQPCPPPDDVPIFYKNKTCDQVTHGPNLICTADFLHCKCEPGYHTNNGCLCVIT